MGLGQVLLVGIGCFVLTVSAAPGDCSFDDGFCGYEQDLNDHFNWTRHNGTTPSSNTGPNNDHTTGSGKGSYVYIETSWPRLNKESARLISPVINGNCVRFSYSIYGLNVRQLNVYTQEGSGSRALRWTLRGDQGSSEWRSAGFALPSSPTNIRIVFEGFSGTGYMGDIAIDDIQVSDSSNCDVLPSEAMPVVVPPTLPPTPPDFPFCGIKPQDSRIVGGNEAPRGAWPWQAMLMYFAKSKNYWKQFCGGTLITPFWVVTASHCINEVRKQDYIGLRIRMGAHFRNATNGTEQDLEVERIYTHPDYNLYPAQFDNDIALIKLKRPAMLNQWTGLACLPSDTLTFSPGTECFISGWGKLKSGGSAPDVLHQAKVALVSSAICTRNGSYDAIAITDRMQCAGYPGQGGIDTCQGDSGGPLVCENSGLWYLVGVTSWGYSCADPNYPGVYAKVSHLKTWLYQVIAHPYDQ